LSRVENAADLADPIILAWRPLCPAHQVQQSNNIRTFFPKLSAAEEAVLEACKAHQFKQLIV